MKRPLNDIRVIFNIAANFSPNLEFNSGNRLFSSESEISHADISRTGKDRTKLNVANESLGRVTPFSVFEFLFKSGLVSFGGHSRIICVRKSIFFQTLSNFFQGIQKVS